MTTSCGLDDAENFLSSMRGCREGSVVGLLLKCRRPGVLYEPRLHRRKTGEATAAPSLLGIRATSTYSSAPLQLLVSRLFCHA